MMTKSMVSSASIYILIATVLLNEILSVVECDGQHGGGGHRHGRSGRFSGGSRRGGRSFNRRGRQDDGGSLATYGAGGAGSASGDNADLIGPPGSDYDDYGPGGSAGGSGSGGAGSSSDAGGEEEPHHEIVAGEPIPEIPGIPGEDYPIFNEPPESAFTCENPGYYADPEADCQVFHICSADANGGLLKNSFLCPNGTIFNQQYFICDWWFNFDCSEAESLYSLNDEAFGGDEGGDASNSDPQSQYGSPDTAASEGQEASSSYGFPDESPPPDYEEAASEALANYESGGGARTGRQFRGSRQGGRSGSRRRNRNGGGRRFGGGSSRNRFSG